MTSLNLNPQEGKFVTTLMERFGEFDYVPKALGFFCGCVPESSRRQAMDRVDFYMDIEPISPNSKVVTCLLMDHFLDNGSSGFYLGLDPEMTPVFKNVVKFMNEEDNDGDLSSSEYSCEVLDYMRVKKIMNISNVHSNYKDGVDNFLVEWAKMEYETLNRMDKPKNRDFAQCIDELGDKMIDICAYPIKEKAPPGPMQLKNYD